ncbi:MAG: ribose-5-phosphate isomerase [Parcubacteria group bacterium]|nr:ribose-5-phosphate isomerase [Parcubacteria group bacterium]
MRSLVCWRLSRSALLLQVTIFLNGHNMKIFIGADHAGFGLKDLIKQDLLAAGHEVVDCGAAEYNEDDDYPDFVIPIAKAVSLDANAKGIVIGGTGQGEAICANKFKGIRAAVWYGSGNQIASDTEKIIELSREHNDANVLSIGARFVTEEETLDAVHRWLETPFSGDERHKRRIEKIHKVEASSDAH